MSAISAPFVPVQPVGMTYPVLSLYTFHVFTIPAQYVAIYGQDPPAYDPTKRQKNWFDTTVDLSDPSALVTYMVYRRKPDGSYKYEAIGMSAAEAATLNIAAPTNTTIINAAPNPLVPWEVPARALLPNEGFAPAIMGSTVLMIQNNDLVVAQQAGSGDYTSADRTRDNKVAEDTAAIRNHLGI